MNSRGDRLSSVLIWHALADDGSEGEDYYKYDEAEGYGYTGHVRQAPIPLPEVHRPVYKATNLFFLVGGFPPLPLPPLPPVFTLDRYMDSYVEKNQFLACQCCLARQKYLFCCPQDLLSALATSLESLQSVEINIISFLRYHSRSNKSCRSRRQGSVITARKSVYGGGGISALIVGSSPEK